MYYILYQQGKYALVTLIKKNPVRVQTVITTGKVQKIIICTMKHSLLWATNSGIEMKETKWDDFWVDQLF